jgi:hypothetical protein
LFRVVTISLLVCPKEEDLGLLMLSVNSCCMYWQEEGEKEGGCWGQVRGIKRRLLTLKKDTARMGIHNYIQAATIP